MCVRERYKYKLFFFFFAFLYSKRKSVLGVAYCVRMKCVKMVKN